MSAAIVAALLSRGVRIPAPAAVVVDDVDPERFEAGVVLHPGTTVRGMRSAFGAGTELGRAGGGCFVDVVAGRDCDLYGGVFEDCALLDGVVVRGHAEVRGGTLLEEGCEAAHHVGYKMTVMMPFTVAGSLVNFCDALFAGGTGRDDHGEIGSCLALYNYTPWGDKFASLFGDVPRGVLLRSPRVFVGGQARIVSPVTVGFGTVVVAGGTLRKSVGDGRIVGESPIVIDEAFDAETLGAVWPKLSITARFIGNLRALEAWYLAVRLPHAANDASRALVYEHALRQIRAGLKEREKRLVTFMRRVPTSLARYRERMVSGGDGRDEDVLRRRIADHVRALDAWAQRAHELAEPPPSELVGQLGSSVSLDASRTYVDAVRALSDETVDAARNCLESITRRYMID